MASSAGLLAGLQSFDSSEADNQESHRLGFAGAGGITFGSLAASFNAEEEEDELNFQAINRGQKYQDESSSITEQEERDELVEARIKSINKQHQQPFSSLANAINSNVARMPAPTVEASVKRVATEDYYSLQSRLKSNTLPSAVLDLSRREGDISEGGSDLMGRDASWRNTNTPPGTTATNRGTVKVDGPRPNLALRDQEKVILIPSLHLTLVYKAPR
jgi:hypothetical protein